MGDKKSELEPVQDIGEKTPEVILNLPPATKRISGFRRKPRSETEYSEGPRTTERPMSANESGAEVKLGIMATRDRLETLMEPALAKSRFRAMGLDDQLDEPFLNSIIFDEIVAEKVQYRESIIAALHRNHRYINNWWDSKNPIERLWGQLNNAFLIIPRWQFVEDLKTVLGGDVATATPAGYADENLVVVVLNKEVLKQKVYAKVVNDGFPHGAGNKVYTDTELSAIIATKPKEDE